MTLLLEKKLSTRAISKNSLIFELKAGNTILKNHLETCAKNAKYTSPQVQNELIEICGDVLRREIVAEVNKIGYWAILANESADVSGKEQLSLAVRYSDVDQKMLKEEFLGYVELTDQTASGIADVIIAQRLDYSLEMSNLDGQDYNGCSTMAGKESGVQQRITSLYSCALFSYCSSHRIISVINDLNNLPPIRNASGTVKCVIKFFRESPAPRCLVPNVPLFCETRWTEKYKSIRLFSENFIKIVKVLENLAESGHNVQT